MASNGGPFEEPGIKDTLPICSMYGIFTNIHPINGPNVGKYTIHGAYGYSEPHDFRILFRTEKHPEKPSHPRETAIAQAISHRLPSGATPSARWMVNILWKIRTSHGYFGRTKNG